MSRNKEGLILLLDIGPSMHEVLPEVEKVCSLLVQKKLIFGKSDEVGIVLFGAEGTENELEKEVGGYEHVVVLRNIKVVDGDAVEALKNLPRGTFYGDFLDAIVVGMDMLIKKYGPTNKGKQRLCLITDAQYPIKEPYEGTKEDQVAAISQQMKAHGMKLDCIVFRRKSMSAAEQIIAHENDHLLDQFSRNTIAKTLHVYDPTSLSGALRTRNIAPVTVYRGDLELSPTMKIKVWVYKKTAEEKFPSMKKYSDKAPPSDKFATHEVKVDFEYKSMNDTDKVVPPEQRVKGYRYGPQVVPISSAEWEAVKFKPEKSVKLLGFTNASNIMRHYYMKDVYTFIPEPGNNKATVAVSAIARAMKEMNKAAILRCVWRQGQANVVIGVLTPNISSVDNIRFYRFLDLKSKEPDADVLPLDKSLERITKSDPKLISQNKSVIENLQKYFELKENPKKKKSSRIAWRENLSISNEAGVKADGETSSTSHLLKDSSAVKVEKISDLNPVQDFEAMMARRDSSKWVTQAIKEMQNYIFNLLENSYEGDAYPKAIDCLLALRRGCICEQEPKEFNKHLHELYEKLHKTDLANFFELLPSKNIKLISRGEAADSDVTEEEAERFPVKTEVASQ